MERRRFLRWAFQGSVAVLVGGCGEDNTLVPFVGEGDYAVGRREGEGLGARLRYDHSKLTGKNLVTPNAEFFVRTSYPDGRAPARPWTIDLGGRATKLDDLRPHAKPMGEHLLECAGNWSNGHFGLISAARWTGIDMARVLAGFDEKRAVLVAGFDDHSEPYAGSSQGASWIFPLAALRRGFLATGMNGVPLPRDHGAPVRLVMPGWYGCCAIKWVTRIVSVADDAPATRHMVEFASRTHQRSFARHARDFEPATIDPAAMAVRVERVDEGYLVTGIQWGGAKPVRALRIRFGPDEDYVPVERFEPRSHRSWNLWTHRWRPRSPGRYRIQLRVADTGVRTRRLAAGYYTRAVDIGEV